MSAIQPEADRVLQQHALEIGMTDLGIARYRRNAAKAVEQGNELGTPYGAMLLDTFVSPVETAIADYIRERESGKAGQKGKAYGYLKLLNDCRVAAYLALRDILNGISKSRRVAAVASSIAGSIEDEVRLSAVRDHDRRYFDWLKETVNKRSSYHTKRTVAVHYLNKHKPDELPWESWPNKDKIILGQLLVETVINTTGLVEKHTTFTKRADTTIHLVPTEKALSHIRKRSATAALLAPVYEPMVVPPADWEGGYGGGHLTSSVRPLRLVKGAPKEYLDALSEVEMPLVYAAVNAAQRTPWRINGFDLLGFFGFTGTEQAADAIMQVVVIIAAVWAWIEQRMLAHKLADTGGTVQSPLVVGLLALFLVAFSASACEQATRFTGLTPEEQAACAINVAALAGTKTWTSMDGPERLIRVSEMCSPDEYKATMAAAAALATH